MSQVIDYEYDLQEAGWTEYTQVEWNTTLGHGNMKEDVYEREVIQDSNGNITKGSWKNIGWIEGRKSRTLGEAREQENFSSGQF